jgi:hypothetical protein
MPKSYIRGPYADAACDLIDHLKTLGIPSMVGYSTRPWGRGRVLTVRTASADTASIPGGWGEFRVRVEVIRTASQNADGENIS